MEGCDFSHIAEMDIITLAHKRDMTYDFYLKHNMSAFEWKLNAMINKDKNLINKFPKNWRHPINMKFNCYRNNSFNFYWFVIVKWRRIIVSFIIKQWI